MKLFKSFVTLLGVYMVMMQLAPLDKTVNTFFAVFIAVVVYFITPDQPTPEPDDEENP